MPEITEEELQSFNRYKELGEVDSISASLASLTTLERDASIQQAAELVGYKPSALSRLATDVTIEIKDGKAMVGDVELEQYAQENWEDFLPALKATSETVKQTVPFVRQPTKPVKEVDNTQQLVSSFLKRTYSAPKAETVN